MKEGNKGVLQVLEMTTAPLLINADKPNDSHLPDSCMLPVSMENKNENFTFDDFLDCAILSHGFMPYMRDYCFIIETNWNEGNAGKYQLLFKHCYEFKYTAVPSPDSIINSWDDLFTHYEEWKKAGAPEGFVWGANWSMAYPGFSLVEASELAQKWTAMLGKEMEEMEVETEAYKLNFIFHEWSLKKLSNDTDLINKASTPFGE